MNSSSSTSSAIDNRAITTYITLVDDYLNDLNKENIIISDEQYRLFDHLNRKLQQLSCRLQKSKKENGTMPNNNTSPKSTHSSSTKTENSDDTLNEKLDKRTVEVSKNHQDVQQEQEPSRRLTQREKYAKYPISIQNLVNRLIYDDDVNDSTKEVISSTNTYENKTYAEEGIIYVNKYYKCTLCKVDRLTKDDMMSHRVVQQHRINVKNINMEELVEFMTNLPQVLKEDEDDMLYIVKGIESEFRCRVCKCELPTMHHVNDHLTSDGHKKMIDY